MTGPFLTHADELHREVGALLAAPALVEERDVLDPLRAALAVQSRAAALVASAAEHAREAGATWQEIGDVLGVSRQAAFQRFGKPIDPRTGEVMSTTPLPDSVQLAEMTIDELSAGEWDKIASRFDPPMRAGLSSSGLAAAWSQVIGLVGAFEAHGPVEATRAADVTTTNTPLHFEAGDFTARISFRDDRTIAGLFILPTGPSGA